ncbi:CvpA family protein [Ligilactobacillus sp. LYQ139]|uniref:CvpA family protein n=1 Tax=Ligilactobacillus sp. LYQ139 TaxID=3378800 RepID=UPI003854BC36
MVSVIIVLLLLLALRHGYRRGLIRGILNFISVIVTFIISIRLSGTVGRFLAGIFPAVANTGDWLLLRVNLNLMFYKFVAFWVVAIICGIIARFIVRAINRIADLPLLATLNRLAGAVFSFLTAYVVIFGGLLLLSAWPVASVRQAVSTSMVANAMLMKTPGLSTMTTNSVTPAEQGGSGQQQPVINEQ